MSAQPQPEQSISSTPINDKVAFLKVSRAIFHLIPVHKKGTDEIAPTLMEEETPLDSESTQLVQERVKTSLASPQAFEVEFNPNHLTPVRALVEEYFATPSPQLFIDISQKLARTLHAVQKGYNSPGLLSVLHCTVGKEIGLVILKLKNETGSRLFQEDAGRRHYEMEVLRDLFLTEGTRIFKCALFVPALGGMQILASDDQRGSTRQYEVALFFLEQFLGCKRLEVAHVLTKRFYNAAVDFINVEISESTERNELYDDLTSQLRRQTKRIDLKEFARDFVPKPQRDQFLTFMKERSLPMAFDKDTSEIRKFFQKKHIRTRHKIDLRIPEDAQELVRVESNKIIINDSPEEISGNA
jgi:37-kD nucleoid-associated bacterial protein